MKRFLYDLLDRLLWWIEDVLDWAAWLADRYAYAGRHRGKYDWDIGRPYRGTYWEWSGTFTIPAELEDSYTLIFQPLGGAENFPALIQTDEELTEESAEDIWELWDKLANGERVSSDWLMEEEC